MGSIAHHIHSFYLEIGGALGIAISIIVTIWVDRFSRVPLATIISSCLYGIAAASIVAMTQHIYRLPDYGSANVWAGFVALNVCNLAVMSALYLTRSFFFGKG